MEQYYHHVTLYRNAELEGQDQKVGGELMLHLNRQFLL